MFKYQIGIPAEMPINPEILSQTMSAQGAGQGVDFNGNPTPNISGQPSFADMAQEIQERYDKLIIPSQRKLEKLKAKLKENPTDQTIKNEIKRLEERIDQLEQQEDMELQQLEAEVEKSGEIIDQQKQMEGYGDMQGEVPEEDVVAQQSPEMMEQMQGETPMMQKGGRIGKKQSGNEAWERSNTVTLDPVIVKPRNYPWPYFAKNPLFASSQMPNIWQLPEMRNGLPKFKLPDITPVTTTNTTSTPAVTNSTDNKKNWWETFKSNLAERPVSDYTQIGLRLGELASSYGKHMAELIGNNKITGNPYRRNIDSITQSKSDALNDTKRYFDVLSAQNRRDLNRTLAQGQYGSLAGKTAYNNAVLSKFNEYADKMNAERESALSKTRLAYDDMLDKAHTQYNEYENAKDMYNRNSMISMLQTLNKTRNEKLKRMYEMADLFSDASQDQRDYNFLMGPWSNNYKMFSTMRNFLSRLTPEDRQKLLENLETTENQ